MRRSLFRRVFGYGFANYVVASGLLGGLVLVGQLFGERQPEPTAVSGALTLLGASAVVANLRAGVFVSATHLRLQGWRSTSIRWTDISRIHFYSSGLYGRPCFVETHDGRRTQIPEFSNDWSVSVQAARNILAHSPIQIPQCRTPTRTDPGPLGLPTCGE